MIKIIILLFCPFLFCSYSQKTENKLTVNNDNLNKEIIDLVRIVYFEGPSVGSVLKSYQSKSGVPDHAIRDALHRLTENKPESMDERVYFHVQLNSLSALDLFGDKSSLSVIIPFLSKPGSDGDFYFKRSLAAYLKHSDYSFKHIAFIFQDETTAGYLKRANLINWLFNDHDIAVRKKDDHRAECILMLITKISKLDFDLKKNVVKWLNVQTNKPSSTANKFRGVESPITDRGKNSIKSKLLEEPIKNESTEDSGTIVNNLPIKDKVLTVFLYVLLLMIIYGVFSWLMRRGKQ